MSDTLFITLQHLLPQHLLSRGTGWLASTRIKAIKNTFIRRFGPFIQQFFRAGAGRSKLALFFTGAPAP